MENKLILITGASSGIGEACARVFAKNGCRLILNARNKEKLEALKKELEEAYGTDILLIPFDVRNREDATRILTSLPEEWKAVDVLINNAGLALGTEKEHEGDLDDLYTMIDTNVKGLLLITQLVVPGMVERGRGHIINIGSVAGDAAYPGGAVYCATKSAVKVLSDGLRMDLYDTPIRVTNLKPGLVETNFSNTRFHGDKAEAKKVYKGINPLSGNDIAEVAYFAASAPAHVQIAEVLVLATHQASAQWVWREK
ncbi:MAG: SDR family NAD(P)-dependent oxidoreductase [Prevotella sp.]|nr:SDR family NAD(P)-dependent oxidoreductase [Prevotella sp.]